jgi:hypothetical protein
MKTFIMYLCALFPCALAQGMSWQGILHVPVSVLSFAHPGHESGTLNMYGQGIELSIQGSVSSFLYGALLVGYHEGYLGHFKPGFKDMILHLYGLKLGCHLPGGGVIEWISSQGTGQIRQEAEMLSFTMKPSLGLRMGQSVPWSKSWASLLFFEFQRWPVFKPAPEAATDRRFLDRISLGVSLSFGKVIK